MKAKSWARKQDPVLHPKNNRQMRVTVFGAISPCLQNGRVMRLARSTNKQDFMAFLVDIKTSILPMYRSETQILLFDGARAHTCRDSQEFMKDYFKGLQIPVMSCEFNCTYLNPQNIHLKAQISEPSTSITNQNSLKILALDINFKQNSLEIWALRALFEPISGPNFLWKFIRFA